MLVPFAVLAAVLAYADPPSVAQLDASDPIVQALYAWTGRAAIPIVAFAICGTLLLIQVPDRPALWRGLRLALVGAAAAGAVLLILRLVFGSALPGFIPPEEGAKPGLLLGLDAGVVEEAVFRLAVLPATYFLALRVMDRLPAMALAVVATGLLFALAHEVGPGAGAFDAWHLITRFAIPGVMFSVLFFRIGPAFIVSAHCTAHLFLPMFFA